MVNQYSSKCNNLTSTQWVKCVCCVGVLPFATRNAVVIACDVRIHSALVPETVQREMDRVKSYLPLLVYMVTGVGETHSWQNPAGA